MEDELWVDKTSAHLSNIIIINIITIIIIFLLLVFLKEGTVRTLKTVCPHTRWTLKTVWASGKLKTVWPPHTGEP